MDGLTLASAINSFKSEDYSLIDLYFCKEICQTYEILGEACAHKRFILKVSSFSKGSNIIQVNSVNLTERNQEFHCPCPGFHLTFFSPSPEVIEKWHRRGVDMGASDKGDPKIWTELGPNYHAAYLANPGSWQIEAVFRTT